MTRLLLSFLACRTAPDACPNLAEARWQYAETTCSDFELCLDEGETFDYDECIFSVLYDYDEDQVGLCVDTCAMGDWLALSHRRRTIECRLTTPRAYGFYECSEPLPSEREEHQEVLECGCVDCCRSWED